MSLKFTKEMFEISPGILGRAISMTEFAAEIAQAQFSKWLESQPIVYSWGSQHSWCTEAAIVGVVGPVQARLMNIKPIEKPKLCDHVFSDLVIKPAGDLPLVRATCTKCGQIFQSTGWKEVK